MSEVATIPELHPMLNPEAAAPYGVGIHENIEFPAYLGLQILSKHALDKIEQSELHVVTTVLAERGEGQKARSQALEFGTWAHSAVLEPHTVKDRFAVGPEAARNTKAWKEFEAAHPGLFHVKPSEAAQLQGMIEGLMRKSTIRGVLSEGIREVSILAQDPTGLMLKGRPDFISVGDDFVLDYKTCRNAEIKMFERDSSSLMYDLQAAFYLRLLAAAGKPKKAFLILAQEKEPPYECQLFSYDYAVLEDAHRILEKRIFRMAACAQTGFFPGYPDEVTNLGKSAWRWSQDELR